MTDRKPTEQLRHFAGDYAKPEVWTSKQGKRRAKITCRLCDPDPRKGKRWVSRSDGLDKGQGSSMAFALDRWADHLDSRHPGHVCPWSTDDHRGKATAEYEQRQAVMRREYDALLREWQDSH